MAQTQDTQTPNAPAVQIIAQYVKDLSFEAPGLPAMLLGMTTPPAITVDIDVKVNKTDQDGVFTVELTIKANATAGEDKKTLFICELVYGGLVAMNVPKEHLEPMLLVEIPLLLFPYARAIISNITRDAGLPPLQVNPIDFAALYRQRSAQNQQEKAN